MSGKVNSRTEMKYLGFVWRVLRRLVWETMTDTTAGLAAQMAYLLLFALAPGLLFLWHVLGWFGIIILFCFNAMVFGETLAGIAEVNFQLKIPLQEWVAALNLPFTAVALIILALLLYLLTPENYLTLRQALPGAIFFAVGWIIATKLFQIYVARYDRYNPTYLALASIIVLLTWMYLTCLLLLLGGKLNAIIRRQREKMRRAEPLAPAPAAPPA